MGARGAEEVHLHNHAHARRHSVAACRRRRRPQRQQPVPQLRRLLRGTVQRPFSPAGSASDMIEDMYAPPVAAPATCPAVAPPDIGRSPAHRQCPLLPCSLSAALLLSLVATWNLECCLGARALDQDVAAQAGGRAPAVHHAPAADRQQ